MANDAMVGWAWALAVLALLHGFLPFVFERLFTEKKWMLLHFLFMAGLFALFVWRYTEYKKSKDKKV